jgi:hypothetical protein
MVVSWRRSSGITRDPPYFSDIAIHRDALLISEERDHPFALHEFMISTAFSGVTSVYTSSLTSIAGPLWHHPMQFVSSSEKNYRVVSPGVFERVPIASISAFVFHIAGYRPAYPVSIYRAEWYKKGIK